MDPLTVGAITGGLSLLGTHASNQASSAQAARQMAFQEEMSSTAHQREIEDLRKAGLNPILSALGSGSSSPGGASGQVNDLGAGISKGADTALALRAQNKELQQKDVQIDNTREDTFNKQKMSALIANQASASAKDVEAKTMTNRVLRETLDSQIKKAKAEGDYSEINQIMGIINSGASSAGQIISPIKFPGKK